MFNKVSNPFNKVLNFRILLLCILQIYFTKYVKYILFLNLIDLNFLYITIYKMFNVSENYTIYLCLIV